METEPMNALKADLLEGMRDYMESVAEDGGDAGYSEDDIGKCDSILTVFIDKTQSAGSGDTESVIGIVKETVLSLNVLNESCGHSLIETDQREQLCELIIQAAADKGVGGGEDITEEWREW